MVSTRRLAVPLFLGLALGCRRTCTGEKLLERIHTRVPASR